MLRTILIICIFIFSNALQAQPLLANGSLNDRNVCTEFKALCAPEAWFFLPTYIVRSQTEDSNFYEVLAMGGISRTSGEHRNYIYTKILCTLKPGKQYVFSIWVKTFRNSFDHLDVWMGRYEPGKRTSIYSITNPTFTITAEDVDSSKNDWKKYKVIYTAKGDEQFLMLGNLSAERMDKSKTSSLGKRDVVLYGIDNITLSPVDSTEKVCAEYNAVLKQVYDQNKRHPPGFIEDIEIDTSLITKEPAREREVIWVIVDTPPSIQKPLNDTLTIPNVLFLYNSSKLNPAFKKDLDNILGKLKSRPFKGLEITGYTDNIGTSAYNIKLSIERAKAIKDYLVTKLQLAPSTITIKGAGETNPVATNKTDEGRQKNRRVEIILKH
jgi:outer membrane protein OmpA-like peptidoglycan-associated protein